MILSEFMRGTIFRPVVRRIARFFVSLCALGCTTAQSIDSPPAGSVWTGEIQARFVQRDETGLQEWDVRIDVRLREEEAHRVAPEAPIVFTTFNPAGSVIRNSLRIASQGTTCSGEASRIHRGRPGGGSTLVMKTGDASAAEIVGYDIPKGETVYVLSIRLPSAEQFKVQCRGRDRSASFDTGFLSPVIGRLAGIQSFDPFPRFTRGGIMVGSYQASSPDGLEMSVAWSVCREGVKCPALSTINDER